MTLSLYDRTRQRAYLAYGRVTRGMTLGVRAVLLKDGAVMLVKHTYLPGWYFPGGGVDRGESIFDALHREIREEAGAVLSASPRLFSVYRNAHASPRDHVALFVCDEWKQTAPPKLPSFEIAACESFAVDALPDDASPGTLRRLREVLEGEPPTADW